MHAGLARERGSEESAEFDWQRCEDARVHGGFILGSFWGFCKGDGEPPKARKD